DNSNSDNDSNVKGHDDEICAVRRPEKIQRPSAFSQSSSRTKSKQSYRRKEDDNGLDNSEVEENQPTTSHLLTTYKSNASIERTGPRDMGATATCEIETEHDKDAQAQFERTQAIAKEMKGKSDDKVYRGMSAYGQFYEKKDSLLGNASSGLNRKGPIRAPTNVRMSTRWDYQPDICKDYKETGFCGFGDSCKFLHDRSDYKHGWEIEREYNEGRYGKADEDPHQFEISDEEDELPFKCLICRNAFIDPIITKFDS
uniref:C3H1-type domain-containing protein n=1 Tax=Romanomermis culicivorax TaxID=13658 RepID=A0A915KY28_ROMCU